MTYWDDENPWRDRVVYVPAGQLAEALAGCEVQWPRGPVINVAARQYLDEWDRLGEIDTYILKTQAGFLAGIRYGAQEHEYLSPHVRDQAAVQGVYEQHCDRIRPRPSVRRDMYRDRKA